MSRTYSRKSSMSMSAESFADDVSGSSQSQSSGKRAKSSSSSPSAVRQLLVDEAEFLLMGNGEGLDLAALSALVKHKSWCEVGLQVGMRFAAVLAAPGRGPVGSADEATAIAGIAPFSGEHASRLLARCADAPDLCRDACIRLLEQPACVGVNQIGQETAGKLVAACTKHLAEAGWLGLLERLSSCSDGRAAMRGEHELLDALAQRLEQQREESVFRLLVNVSNESAETASRLCRTQLVLLAATRVLEGAELLASFDLVLLALALAINLLELSTKARQLSRLVGLLPVAVRIFERSSREQLEGKREVV